MMTEYDRTAGVVRLRSSNGATATVSLALPEAEIEAAAAAFFAQHEPPSAPRVMPPRDFMDALSMPRQAEVVAAAMQTPAGMLWCMRLVGAVEVDCDHAETIAGIEAMRDAGAITSAEADALLRR
jgi:hypothetical protein